MREKLARWPRVDSLKKEHLSRVWSRMEREQAAILDTKDALLKEAGKGITTLWRMKQRVDDIMEGLRETLCETCREECRGQEREQREERSMRAPSMDREQRGLQPNKESSAGDEKEKQPVVMLSCDGTRACEPEKQGDGHGLQVFDNNQMTKLIATGGPTALCYQLYIQGGVVVWKQVAVSENGHRGILLMPVKTMSDKVDRKGQGWQGLTWPPAAGAAVKQPVVREGVLKGITKEANGRSRQTVRMRFKTTGEEEQARNEGLTVFTAQRPRAAVWKGEQMARAGQTKDPEKAQEQKKKDGAE